MDLERFHKFYNTFKYGDDNYHELMKNKINEILLLSSYYEAFILEQDGGLSEQIYGEYKQLNLSTAPRITNVPTPDRAMKALKRKRFDLIITLLNVGDMSTTDFAKEVKSQFPDIPILLLLKSKSEVEEINALGDKLYYYIDDIFLWNGDAKIFLAMVKSIEDKRNIENDTRVGMVRVILLVEDSVQYYSIFLPLLYSEIMKQTQLLIQEELNDIQKRLRMRVRPKIILVHNYEDAIYYYNKYAEHILAVISDICFPHSHKLDNEAGIKLVAEVRKDEESDIPCILMSSDISHERKAKELGATFLHKFSRTLLHEIREFMLDRLGFGDFKFRVPGKGVVAVAKTLYDFEEKLKEVPDESLIYHSSRNHFSAWLLARGEIQIAKKLRPLKMKDFESVSDMRNHLVNAIRMIKERRNRGRVINFDPASLNDPYKIVLLSEGSLGGKGRGIAFMNATIVSTGLEERYRNIVVTQPCTAIVGTNEYDRFIDANDIDVAQIVAMSDEDINRIFLSFDLSDELKEKLRIFLQNVTTPLAVRSSGLLEDSISESFAGVYRTYMVPNNHPDVEVRLKQLEDAIKLVYASVFLRSARGYVESIDHKIEEEKMAVVIQQIAGVDHGDGYFYPTISGVAESHNYYPIHPLKYEDSICTMTIGLGRAAVTDGIGYRFSPKYPKINLFNTETLIKKSQRYFYAINLKKKSFDLAVGEQATISRLSIEEAKKHSSLKYTASMYDFENDRIIPYRPDDNLPIVVNFDGIVKYNAVPLTEVLQDILEIGKIAFGRPVEIEFAVEIKTTPPKFYLLQIRPSISRKNIVNMEISQVDKDRAFLFTDQSLGNGIVDNLTDIIYVKPEAFDRTKTPEIQKEIEVFNYELKKTNKRYLLIGPGRWGSSDRFLGIPVRFFQISNAKVIVEVTLEDFVVEPSQGTHFLHNIISMNIGYLAVNNTNKSHIDWEWLKNLQKVKETQYLVHVKTPAPLKVLMDGQKGVAVIYKN